MRHWTYAILVCVVSLLLTIIATGFVNHDVIVAIFTVFAIYSSSHIIHIMPSSIAFDILRHAPPYITLIFITIVYVVCYIDYRNLHSHNWSYRIKYFLSAIMPIYGVYFIIGVVSFKSIIVQLITLIVCITCRSALKKWS